MRICLYTSTALPKLGGQEAVIDSLARQFTRLGHRAVVLAPLPRLPLRPRDNELPYPVVRHPRFYSTKYFVAWYRRWLLRLNAREQFDILHCHDVYPTGYVAALSRTRVAAPLLITSHGGDVKAGNIRISKPGMRPRYVRAIRSADALISIGRFTDEGFRALVPEPPPITTIPNGIDLQPYAQPAARPARLIRQFAAGEYLLFLGRLKHRKGVDLILDAMQRIRRAAEWNWLSPAAARKNCSMAQIQRLGLAGRVRRVGRIDGGDKIYLLQNALCTVMPSRVWEAFPLVLLETYAGGRPVVGTSVPGIVDLVRENETGLLVAENSAEPLAAALQKLLADREMADAMGANARRFVQDYSWNTVADRHLALYDQLLRNPGSLPYGRGSQRT